MPPVCKCCKTSVASNKVTEEGGEVGAGTADAAMVGATAGRTGGKTSAGAEEVGAAGVPPKSLSGGWNARVCGNCVCACGPRAVSVIYVRRTGGRKVDKGKTDWQRAGRGPHTGSSGSTTSNKSSQGSKEGTTVSGSEGRGSGCEQSGGTRPGGGAGGTPE